MTLLYKIGLLLDLIHYLNKEILESKRNKPPSWQKSVNPPPPKKRGINEKLLT